MRHISELPHWHCLRTGLSREDREIGFYICGGATFGPIDTLIMAVFHGDEAESALLIDHFLNRCGPDMLAGRRVGLIPVVNPDGFHLKTRTNARGVDLNRNFPTRDWRETGTGTPFYSGPSAASEPETRFVVNFLENCPPKKIISIHTPYRVINYDGPAERVARAMSECNSYDVVPDIGYPTPGSFGTYAGKEQKIATLTLELPETDFDEAAIESNIQGLLAVINFNL